MTAWVPRRYWSPPVDDSSKKPQLPSRHGEACPSGEDRPAEWAQPDRPMNAQHSTSVHSSTSVECDKMFLGWHTTAAGLCGQPLRLQKADYAEAVMLSVCSVGTAACCLTHQEPNWMNTIVSICRASQPSSSDKCRVHAGVHHGNRTAYNGTHQGSK